MCWSPVAPVKPVWSASWWIRPLRWSAGWQRGDRFPFSSLSSAYLSSSPSPLAHYTHAWKQRFRNKWSGRVPCDRHVSLRRSLCISQGFCLTFGTVLMLQCHSVHYAHLGSIFIVLLKVNCSASCGWPAQFSIQVLLSESFEVWLQRYVLLHAGVIETLKVNKM